MPDWAKLWARDPSLKPAHLNHHGDGGWTMDGCEDSPPAEVAEALCRDSAVRWLAEHSDHVRIYDPQVFLCWTVGVRIDYKDDGPDAFGKPECTLSEALFDAVEALLDGKRGRRD